MDTLEILECEFCGRKFLPKRVSGKRQKYCGSQCRERAKAKFKLDRITEINELREDNKQLRKNMQEQETILEYYEQHLRENRDDEIYNLALLRKIADDLSLLIETGVIHIDKSHPRAGLLKKHDTFLHVMEKYSINEKELITKQKHLIEELRNKHKTEYQQAVQQNRGQVYLDALKRRQTQETRELNQRCPQYWAWYELQDRRDNFRESNHRELQFFGPEIQSYLRTIENGNTN